MSHLNVIIPYRDRKKHKKRIIKVLYKFLSESAIESFRIYVVEQFDKKPFNKGCLLNIGFLETNSGENDYYCFNDVDTLPKSSLANYHQPLPNTINHPYGHWHCLSNVFFVNADTYKKMNGFSTRFWGWGFEDTDFLLRAKVSKVNVSRANFEERFKSEAYYETDDQSPDDFAKKMSSFSTKINQTLFYNSFLNPDSALDDGITTTDYEVVKRKEHKKYTHIKCKINNTNQSAAYVESAKEFFAFAFESLEEEEEETIAATSES